MGEPIDAPMHHTTLYKDRTDDTTSDYKKAIDRAVEAFKLDLKSEAGMAIFNAYNAGLMDGFQQGVQAEANAERQRRTEAD